MSSATQTRGPTVDEGRAVAGYRMKHASRCMAARRRHMEGRRGYVETSPSPFTSALSPSREINDFSGIRPLPDICYGAQVDGP